MNKNRPTGKLKVKSTKLTQKSDIAVYIDIVLEDEIGNLFVTRASEFIFDLKPKEGAE